MTPAHTAAPAWLIAVGDFRWLRGHVSSFFVGIVLLISTNLLIGSDRLWSVTATGIWLLVLAVHGILLAIARLSVMLIADDEEEEIVLLPVKDAVIVDPQPDPLTTWETAPRPDIVEPAAAAAEPVSWQVAVDAARGRKPTLTDEGPAT